MHKDHKYYTRLKFYHILVIILLSVIPMLAVGWNATEYYERSILDDATASAQRVVENRKQTVSLFLNNQRDVLLSLVKLFPLKDLRHQENLERVFSAVSNSGVIVDLSVINAEGEHLAYVGPYTHKVAGKNFAKTDWFREVMENRAYVSDVFMGYREIPHLIVAVTDPLKTWILRATINSEIFNFLLQAARMSPATDAFIVNKNGEFQTPSLIGKDKIDAVEFEQLVYHEGTQVKTIGDTLYVTSWLNNGHWMFMVEINIPSHLKTYYEAKHFNFLVVIVTSLFIIFLGIFTIRFLVDRIEAADREMIALDDQLAQVQKMAMIGRLAASVAHEVNNPLQMIGDQAGWIEELLVEEEPANIKHHSEYQNSVAKIKFHVHRAAKVTHRLLGFSRKMEPERSRVQINSVLEETLSYFDSETTNNNIKIEKNLQADLPVTMSDTYQLQQVFINIINNAFDAMNKNGCLDITTTVSGRHILVQIRDTGPGIKPENIKKIFDPFFTTKELGKGTGLGLPICYNIMQRLGGTISVRNRINGGSLFTVNIPIVTDVESA